MASEVEYFALANLLIDQSATHARARATRLPRSCQRGPRIEGRWTSFVAVP